ncbi:MAG: response regulator [Planctomycetia bacterium]|nr:response regulator [Planctomycetia bacterium]
MPRLLFVDDQLNDFVIWGKPLADDYGWKVQYADGPKAALDELEAHPFDVVIIDRWMPDPETGAKRMIGDELLEQIVARWRYACPIMQTNFGDLAAAQRATRHGAYRYFVKGESSHEELNHACRKGMQWQFAKRVRHSLLSLTSADDVVRKVKGWIREIIEPAGYCFAYLLIGAKGTMMIGDAELGTSTGPLADAIRDHCAFLNQFPSAAVVAKTRQFLLKRARAEIDKQEGTLLDSPGSQLIVPVLKPNDPVRREPAEVIAVIWVESMDENAFDRDDADTLSELADYVGVALAKAQEIQQAFEEGTARAQDFERKGLLGEFSHRICDPLQLAQSTIDLLFARLQRGDQIERRAIEDELVRSRDCVERAIQEAYQLRQITGRRTITVVPTDLAALVEQTIEMYAARCESHSCRIERRTFDTVPKVKVEPAEMRYALGSLLEVSLEAIEHCRKKSGGEPAIGEILVSLCAEPSASQSVALSIEHNGGGIPEEDLLHVFDRYSRTEEGTLTREGEGIRLWTTRRFIDGIGGTIMVRNTVEPDGSPHGVLFQIILPACADDAPAQEVTLP